MKRLEPGIATFLNVYRNCLCSLYKSVMGAGDWYNGQIPLVSLAASVPQNKLVNE